MRKESAISVSAPGEQSFNKDEGGFSSQKRKKNAEHLCIRQIIRTFASAFAQSLSGKTERSLVCCVVTITI